MHDNQAVEHRCGEGDSPLVLVFAHGRGREPAEMAALADRLDQPGMRAVLLRADDATWYPGSFMAETSENEPHLSHALRRYEEVIQGLLDEGVAPARIVIGGFSQGACLSCEYLARHPRKLGGAIIWTGGLIGPPGQEWSHRPELEGVPIYLASGLEDTWVPAARVRETRDWFKACGVDLEYRMFEERDHIVSDREVLAASNLLRKIRARIEG